MNDEIKEIKRQLKYLENWLIQHQRYKIMGDLDSIFSFNLDDLQKFYDYIINLQQEIKIKDTNWESLKYYIQRLFDKDYIEEEIFDDICNKVNELESQIEIKGYQKDIEHLQQRLEDETLCKEIAQGHRDEVRDRESRELEELKDYKSRNKKAIEYIKVNGDDLSPKYLLEILQGSDKE